MGDQIKAFIIKYLEKKQPFPEGVDVGEYRYLDVGHIDSIGVLKFIAVLEDEFDIEISSENMLSEQFRTVGGLIAMIDALQKGEADQ